MRPAVCAHWPALCLCGRKLTLFGARLLLFCVCAQGLTSLGAVVLCGSLGYENGDVLAGPVPPGSGPIAITDLSCSGQGALPRSHTRA